jgi:hypothetical protein
MSALHLNNRCCNTLRVTKSPNFGGYIVPNQRERLRRGGTNPRRPPIVCVVMVLAFGLVRSASADSTSSSSPSAAAPSSPSGVASSAPGATVSHGSAAETRSTPTAPTPSASTAAAALNIPNSPYLPLSLRRSCASNVAGLQKQTGPDGYETLLNSHPRYRLVVGSDSFANPVVNSALHRPFVRTTAALVDSRLDALGYQPLPSRTNKLPYLVGSDATKQAVRDALSELATLTSQGGTGFVYYVGHGSTADNHFDVSYSVYDRPVESDEGIRGSDILGLLTVDTYQNKKAQIPRFIVIFDSCYSGNIIPYDKTEIIDRNGSQVAVKLNSGFPIPDNIVLMTASSGGSASLVYPMNETDRTDIAWPASEYFSN